MEHRFIPVESRFISVDPGSRTGAPPASLCYWAFTLIKNGVQIVYVVSRLLLQLYTEADSRAVLDAMERIANVGIEASTALQDYSSVVVYLLNGTEPSNVDVMQFRKRPPTLQYRMSLGNETFTISLQRNTHMVSSG
ncbi:hypothetical protein DPMN_174438 [Dreissena polymorpha]|uniref:Uncharacterized protein n=1 Tax=Dreissena polymorpha TaxID=45954 RepID=A0A9D4E7G4_DREPO|nr:hypothetical protein DPMN_174438 [Dreissena polymorpha]